MEPDRPISPAERSGVLHPSNLARYSARWFAPDAAVGSVVDHYWSVTWNLGPDEVIDQVIIAAPAVTLTIEEGDAVPAEFVVTGVHHGAWRRSIGGRGAVFGIRLRPAGLAVCTDLTPGEIANATIPLTPEFDARAHRMLSDISSPGDPADLAMAADRSILRLLRERPLDRVQKVANDVVDAIARRADPRDVSERTAQRALKRTIGQGPKWVKRWVRLQELARRLSVHPDADVARIAVDLGYADQSHLVNDFRSATGMTPGAYARELRALVRV